MLDRQQITIETARGEKRMCRLRFYLISGFQAIKETWKSAKVRSPDDSLYLYLHSY